MYDIVISYDEMREFLPKVCKNGQKGWDVNRSGYELVFDYKMIHIPVLIKVSTTIDVEGGLSRNKGSDKIRVWAVRVNQKNKVIGGLLKARKVDRNGAWKINLKWTIMETIKDAQRTYYRKFKN